MSEQKARESKGFFVQFPINLISGCPNLTRDDKWVLLAIMEDHRTDGPHKLSFREIASIAKVPLSLLSSYTDKKSNFHEGIIDRIERVTGYLRKKTGKEINELTGKTKGNAQLYIFIDYDKIWQDNIEYSKVKTNRPVSHTNRFQESSPATNEPVPIENTPVSIPNGSVSHTNEPVSNSRSKVPPYIEKINKDIQITEKEREEPPTSSQATDSSFNSSSDLNSSAEETKNLMLIQHPLYDFIFLDDEMKPTTIFVQFGDPDDEHDFNRVAHTAQDVQSRLEERLGYKLKCKSAYEQQSIEASISAEPNSPAGENGFPTVAKMETVEPPDNVALHSSPQNVMSNATFPIVPQTDAGASSLAPPTLPNSNGNEALDNDAPTLDTGGYTKDYDQADSDHDDSNQVARELIIEWAQKHRIYVPEGKADSEKRVADAMKVLLPLVKCEKDIIDLKAICLRRWTKGVISLGNLANVFVVKEWLQAGSVVPKEPEFLGMTHDQADDFAQWLMSQPSFRWEIVAIDKTDQGWCTCLEYAPNEWLYFESPEHFNNPSAWERERIQQAIEYGESMARQAVPA